MLKVSSKKLVLTHFSGVSMVNFEQINVNWVRPFQKSMMELLPKIVNGYHFHKMLQQRSFIRFLIRLHSLKVKSRDIINVRLALVLLLLILWVSLVLMIFKTSKVYQKYLYLYRSLCIKIT